MKKKFDFSAEMSEVESIKTTPKNEYLEEEKRLLDINAKELASLNDNVYKLRTEVENLSGSIRECKPIISEEMQKLAVEFGATLLCNFLGQIESKCKEAERRIKKADNAIHIPATAFYILIIIVVALSSFFVHQLYLYHADRQHPGDVHCADLPGRSPDDRQHSPAAGGGGHLL